LGGDVSISPQVTTKGPREGTAARAHARRARGLLKGELTKKGESKRRKERAPLRGIQEWLGRNDAPGWSFDFLEGRKNSKPGEEANEVWKLRGGAKRANYGSHDLPVRNGSPLSAWPEITRVRPRGFERAKKKE